jgi:hypothetical protein
VLLTLWIAHQHREPATRQTAPAAPSPSCGSQPYRNGSGEAVRPNGQFEPHGAPSRLWADWVDVLAARYPVVVSVIMRARAKHDAWHEDESVWSQLTLPLQDEPVETRNDAADSAV